MWKRRKRRKQRRGNSHMERSQTLVAGPREASCTTPEDLPTAATSMSDRIGDDRLTSSRGRAIARNSFLMVMGVGGGG